MLRWRVVVFAAWVGLVAFYWWLSVPLAATRSTAHGGGVSMVRSAGDLEIMLFRSDSSGRLSGPVQFWDPASGEMTGEMLEAGDQLVPKPPFLDDDFLVVRRDGRLLLFERTSRKQLGEFKDVPDASSYVVHARRGELYIADSAMRTHCFRIGSPLPRWIVENAVLEEVVEGNWQAVTLWGPRKSGSVRGVQRAGMALINVDTGELDRRFETLGKVLYVTLTSDGQYARVRQTAQGHVVCDLEGTVLWSFTLPPGESLQFSPDGSEVLFWNTSDLGPIGVYRRRTVDGVRVDEPPSKELLATLPSGGTDYLVRGGSFGMSSLTVQQWLSRYHSLCLRWGLARLAIRPGDSRWLVDAKSGRILGGLPGGAHFARGGGGRGLVAVTATHINYYSLPPRRNYGWLATWAVGPPLVLLVLGRGGRRARVGSGG